MIWSGVRFGHSPREVGWHWSITTLLSFMHCELRRSGLKTYRMNKKPITTHDIDAARKAVIDDVTAWDIDIGA